MPHTAALWLCWITRGGHTLFPTTVTQEASQLRYGNSVATRRGIRVGITWSAHELSSRNFFNADTIRTIARELKKVNCVIALSLRYFKGHRWWQGLHMSPCLSSLSGWAQLLQPIQELRRAFGGRKELKIYPGMYIANCPLSLRDMIDVNGVLSAKSNLI